MNKHSENKSPQEGTLPSNNQENAEGGLANLGEVEGSFVEKSIRRGLIRKIYILLTIQLTLTVGLICLFIYWRLLKIWIQANSWLILILLMAMLILVIILACFEEPRRKTPLNYILLLIFTIVEGILLGSIASFFDADGVMWAIGGTALVTLGLSLFALQTKLDLTITSGILLVIFFVFLFFAILSLILKTKLMSILFSAVGTLLFSLYLVVDTQLMLGREHRYKLTAEDYIFAVLNLYIDIVNLAIFILQFIGWIK